MMIVIVTSLLSTVYTVFKFYWIQDSMEMVKSLFSCYNWSNWGLENLDQDSFRTLVRLKRTWGRVKNCLPTWFTWLAVMWLSCRAAAPGFMGPIERPEIIQRANFMFRQQPNVVMWTSNEGWVWTYWLCLFSIQPLQLPKKTFKTDLPSKETVGHNRIQ